MPLDNNLVIDAVAQKHPLHTKALYRSVLQGGTVADIVAGFELDSRYGVPQVHLMRGGEMTVVPIDMWSKVRPKAGTRLEVSYKVEGPIAALAVSALTAAAPAIVGTLFPTLVAGTFWYTVAVAAITVVGSLVLNALIPPVKQQNQGPENYTITGIQNMENRYGVFPKVLGRMRMYPMKTARGFTETVGRKIHYRGRMTFGWGPLSLEDLRIGTTPIHEFEGVELEFLNVDQAQTLANYPQLAGITKAWRTGTQTLTLCPDDVLEDVYNIRLMYNQAHTRYTRERTESASVDVAFPQGIGYYSKRGNGPFGVNLTFAFRYRQVGTSTWRSAGNLTCSAGFRSYIRFSKQINFPTPGEYEIEIRRTSGNRNGSRELDASHLTAIRSYRSGELPSYENIAEVAFKLQASEQLSGNVDSLNAIVRQHAPIWDGTTWSIPQPVRHPAWIFLDALRGDHLRRPIDDERIEVEAFRAWATQEPHWTCDYVIDTDTRVADVLDIIAGAGRARRALTDLQYSILRDNANGPIRQMFSPRNSWGFKAKLVFPKELHALRCLVRSERLEWEQDEVTVYADGHDHSTATEFETLEIPGVVITKTEEDVGNAWKLGRYHMAQAKLRPETYEWYADWEHMRVTRGDKVQLVHDVPVIGIGAARIRDIALPRNLLIWSENFESTTWGKTNFTASTGHGVAPDGVSASTILRETSATGERGLRRNIAHQLGEQHTVSIYVREAGRPFVFLNGGDVNWGQESDVRFDLSTGEMQVGSGVADAGIEPVGDGWYRIWGTFTAITTASSALYFGTSPSRFASVSASFEGDTSLGAEVWGFQREIGPLSAYQRVDAVRTPVIVIDEDFSVHPSTNYRMTVRTEDGERLIFDAESPSVEFGRTWTPAEALPSEVQPGDLVFIEEVAQDSMEVLVTGVYPDGDNARITAVAAAPGVLAADSGVIPPYEPIITEPNDQELLGPVKPTVKGLASDISTALQEHDGALSARAAVWLSPFFGNQASAGSTVQLRWRLVSSVGLDDTPWEVGEQKPITSYLLYTDTLEVGETYDLEVRSVGENGRSRGWIAAGSVVAGIQGAAATPLAANFRALGVTITDTLSRSRKPAIEIAWYLGENNHDIQGLEWQVRVAGQTEVLRGTILDAGQNEDAGDIDEEEKTLTITEGIIADTVYEVRARFVAYREVNWTPWHEVVTPFVGLSMYDMSEELINQFQDIAAQAGIGTVETLPPEGDFDNQIVMLVPGGILYRWDPDELEWSTKVYAGVGPNTVTTDALVAGAVVASKIGAGEVAAYHMDVDELSAITATMGRLEVNDSLNILQSGSLSLGKFSSADTGEGIFFGGRPESPAPFQEGGPETTFPYLDNGTNGPWTWLPQIGTTPIAGSRTITANELYPNGYTHRLTLTAAQDSSLRTIYVFSNAPDTVIEIDITNITGSLDTGIGLSVSYDYEGGGALSKREIFVPLRDLTQIDLGGATRYQWVLRITDPEFVSVYAMTLHIHTNRHTAVSGPPMARSLKVHRFTNRKPTPSELGETITDGGFAFVASRSTPNGVDQEISLTGSEFRLVNAQHYVSSPGEVTAATVTTSTGKTPIPRSVKFIKFPQVIGGGGGGATKRGSESHNAGSDGGDTVVTVYDGNYPRLQVISKGGKGGVWGDRRSHDSVAGQAGVAWGEDASGFGAGGAGSRNGGKTAGGAQASQATSRDWIDISSWADPQIEITIGSGGAPGTAVASGTYAGQGGYGSPGRVIYQTNTEALHRAGVIQQAPTASGVFIHYRTRIGFLPRHGAGFWELWSPSGNLAIAELYTDENAPPLNLTGVKYASFISSISPYYEKNTSSVDRTIHYRFRKM